MKTLNSEPRITLNWMTGAWGVPAFTYATPSKKAAAFDLAMAMAELRNVAAEREKLKDKLAVANWKMDSLACVLDGCRIQRVATAIERDDARQSLRAAEADAAETESVNSDLRTVNARLVADLAAAMERLNHAESIIMQ